MSVDELTQIRDQLDEQTTAPCHLCGNAEVLLRGTKLGNHFLENGETCPGTGYAPHQTERIFETVQRRLAE